MPLLKNHPKDLVKVYLQVNFYQNLYFLALPIELKVNIISKLLNSHEKCNLSNSKSKPMAVAKIFPEVKFYSNNIHFFCEVYKD